MGRVSRSPLTGDELLIAVSERMAALHEHYHGRVPATAKTQMELERSALVHEVRRAFQQAMTPRFVAEVERLSGRRVESFVSTHNVGPDLEIDLFFLAPT